MKHGDATMFITKWCFLKASLQYGKNWGGGIPTYLSVQLTALEAKLITLIGLQQYTEICSLPCSMENTLLEIHVDV